MSSEAPVVHGIQTSTGSDMHGVAHAAGGVKSNLHHVRHNNQNIISAGRGVSSCGWTGRIDKEQVNQADNRQARGASDTLLPRLYDSPYGPMRHSEVIAGNYSTKALI